MKIKVFSPTLLSAVAVLILAVGFNFSDVLAAEGRTSRMPATEKARVKGFSVIDVGTLAEKLKKKDFLLVNVHIPYEGEIEKTDLFLPYNEIEKNIDKLPKDRNAKIVLYCRTDRMSNIAGRKLSALGYGNVIVVSGGMSEWKKQGHELLHKSRQ